jgi:LPS export ABC transporter ATP-binding protein
MPEEKLVLRTENLVKRYHKRTVVDRVSIELHQGEIVGLLGPNGAGKTTTFYMTTGLVVPNEGRIFLGEVDITDYPVYKRAQAGIGYLAQEPSVFRKMSVEDNILSVLEMTKMTRAEQKEKLESLIAEFHLEKVRKNIGDRLSGGERRRTEIARCLAISPKFIMLDEPFAGHIELQHGDGSKRRYEFSEEFTVVEPTATVSNIMMNVLYAGIENELSISVPGVASQDISASVNNGRLSRAGNVWRALPTEVGKECIVSVNAVMDGRSQQVARVPFRVRPLPEPRAFIEYTDENNITRKYRGGEPFAKARIMDAPGVIAALDDDLLDVPFNVLSFETLIYDSMGNTNVEISEGANFSNRQKSQIRRLTRGQRFFIARIKVVGPDKIEQTLSPMEIIIN